MGGGTGSVTRAGRGSAASADRPGEVTAIGEGSAAVKVPTLTTAASATARVAMTTADAESVSDEGRTIVTTAPTARARASRQREAGSLAVRRMSRSYVGSGASGHEQL